MQIEMRSLASISPYANNPRENDAAVEAVAQSLQEFGWRQPLVVDEAGVIIAGHTRYKAALKLGLTEVPVHVAIGLSPEKVQAYRIADNKSGDLSDWNYELLSIELSQLQEQNYEVESLGFSQEELNRILHSGTAEGLTDPDEIPAPPDEAVTQPGDLWILGNHRLLCGDSSLENDVNRLLEGICVQLVNSDPPYGVRVEPRSNNAIAAGNSSFEAPKKRTHHQTLDVALKGEKKATHKKLRAKDRPLANDFVSEQEFDNLLEAWFGQIGRVLEPGRSFYIWGGYANLGNYPAPLKRHGLYFSQAIVWDKQHPVLTRKDMMGAFELAFYGWKEGKAHRFFGPNNATDLWAIKKVNPQCMVHLTEKPVELARRAIEYSSQPGENVLDLFGGSGSTLLAAEQTGRKAYLMELDPLYCDVIVQRFAQFTGQEIQCLDSSGNATQRNQQIKAKLAA